MSATTQRQSAVEQLAAARLRGAAPDELLDLADVAIEQAAADEERPTLELIAAELDSAATAHPERRDGLRVAAARARAALPAPPPPAPAAPLPATQSTADVATFASWGGRLLALVIDWVILGIAESLVTYMLGNAAWILATLGAFGYFAYLNGQGRTIGKVLLRIKVVDATTHGPIGTRRGAVRELVRIAVTVFTLGIGLILDGLRPLWNENHQSWHDAAAKSIVIHTGVTLVRPAAGEGA